MKIRCASKQDSSISAELFYHMWNSQPLQELKEELEEYICGSDHAVFLAYDGKHRWLSPSARCGGIMWRVPIPAR